MTRKSLYGSLAVTLLALCSIAHAAERVTLRNGFQVDCARHETVGDRIRLYLAATGNNSMDVPAAQIAQIEVLPEILADPTPVAAPTPAAPATAAPALIPTTLTDADLHPLLLHAGADHRIDEDLLASIVKAESAGRANAVSRAGARGLMQLMPGTAADLGVANAFVPDQNIAGGAAYLDQLLTRYHDNVALALAAYNAGPTAVDRWHGIPPFAETRAYVRRVILEFNRRKLAAASQTGGS